MRTAEVRPAGAFRRRLDAALRRTDVGSARPRLSGVAVGFRAARRVEDAGRGDSRHHARSRTDVQPVAVGAKDRAALARDQCPPLRSNHEVTVGEHSPDQAEALTPWSTLRELPAIYALTRPLQPRRATATIPVKTNSIVPGSGTGAVSSNERPVLSVLRPRNRAASPVPDPDNWYR